MIKIYEIEKQVYVLKEHLADLINLRGLFYDEFLTAPISGKTLIQIGDLIFQKQKSIELKLAHLEEQTEGTFPFNIFYELLYYINIKMENSKQLAIKQKYLRKAGMYYDKIQ